MKNWEFNCNAKANSCSEAKKNFRKPNKDSLNYKQNTLS